MKIKKYLNLTPKNIKDVLHKTKNIEHLCSAFSYIEEHNIVTLLYYHIIDKANKIAIRNKTSPANVLITSEKLSSKLELLSDSKRDNLIARFHIYNIKMPDNYIILYSLPNYEYTTKLNHITCQHITEGIPNKEYWDKQTQDGFINDLAVFGLLTNYHVIELQN